ncbi:pentapeptide repeat-containing protein [Streptosporangium sp. NPDC000509]|uniref:pentapeptide repeat-containing protein n=1 Tax=Streptosporangium sp. NPDC000509 TaxID=3366186 RepID=UPI003681A3CD
MRKWPGFSRFVLGLLGVLLVAGLAWVLGPGAAWVLEHFDGVRGLAGKDLAAALDAVRGRALTIATGLIALVAVYYTARNAATARRTFELSAQGHRLSEQGHVTERYTKAIEQLGSDKLDIRLGGIYALERVARDSARDHPTVMEVLAAYIREHSRDDDIDQTENDKTTWPEKRLRTDLQAVITVIGRRTVAYDLEEARFELAYVNLARAHLINANLAGAFLSGVDFTGAFLSNVNFADMSLIRANLSDVLLTRSDLTDVDLTGANLTDANLADTNLAGTNLTKALLQRAGLTNVDLTGANLTDANLMDADLTGANLTNTLFQRADLTGVDLTGANLEGTCFDGADLDGVIGLPEHRPVPSMSLPSIFDMVPPVKGEATEVEGDKAR